MYAIRKVSNRLDRELDRLSPGDRERVIAAIDNLAIEPRPKGCEKIEGGAKEYRLRVGRLRVIYQIDDDNQQILIGAIRSRNEATYRRVSDLFG